MSSGKILVHRRVGSRRALLFCIQPVLVTTMSGALSLVDEILKKTQRCFRLAWLKYGVESTVLKVQLFGSQRYGIVTEESDVDMLICLAPEHESRVHLIAKLFLGCLRQEADGKFCKRRVCAYQRENRTVKW